MSKATRINCASLRRAGGSASATAGNPSNGNCIWAISRPSSRTGSRRPRPRVPPRLFDAYSPAKNPAMWTLPLFAGLFQLLDPQRPCALPTYSRSTMLRVSLLLAGFYVGAGHATGEKEETTLAANSLALIEEPLAERWLQRVRQSTSAEPLCEPVYRQSRLSAGSWEKLRQHPQFAGLGKMDWD
ncbi:MAG: MnmC family methyltransferase [Verrucomicrobia bacterium]|nr:MnmC family methyltransferase [Verrucomicrobiota bacterium]